MENQTSMKFYTCRFTNNYTCNALNLKTNFTITRVFRKMKLQRQTTAHTTHCFHFCHTLLLASLQDYKLNHLNISMYRGILALVLSVSNQGQMHYIIFCNNFKARLTSPICHHNSHPLR